MKRKIRNILIFIFSTFSILCIYGLLMYGLSGFNDPSNSLGLRLNETDDDSRTNYPFIGGSNSTFRDVGRAVGYILWEAKGVDIIILGIILLIAAESSSTMMKGIEEQCGEFRKELCETDKFIILAKKDEETAEEKKE